MEVYSGIEARDPLAIAVEENPARIGAFEDLPIYGIIPADVRIFGNPGPGCNGFHPWLKRNGGVDSGTSKLKIIVQGKVSESVLLSEMRVKILERLPPLTGVPVTCPPAGAVEYRSIAIDLDQVPPRVSYLSGKKAFGFTVGKGETEAFTVVATTTQHRYKWLIEFDVVVEGDRRTIQVGASDKPFETTAMQPTEWWSWDYAGAWYTAPGAGVPEMIPAGMPLPPLTKKMQQ